jgi:acetoin utilization deacetylase AcuC-like enzyme
MTTLLYTHDACLEHDTGPTHPESDERLRELLTALSAPEFNRLRRKSAPQAKRAYLARVHSLKYISDMLAGMPNEGRVDADNTGTVFSPGTGVAALHAAGAVCAAVDAVAMREAKNAFCAVRPPGHHAEPDRSKGFCLFNNVAVGAFHAREARGFKRIAVVDFDVHHGNGTQTMFRHEDDMFFASIHQAFLFPNAQTANNNDDGDIINVGLRKGASGKEFREAFETRILIRLEEFKPDFLLLSTGFDSHRIDPLGGMCLGDEDFAWITNALTDIAERHCAGRLVSVMEGGYHPKAVASAGATHVKALMAA